MDKRLKFFEKDTIDWKQHKLRNIYSALFKLKLENKALYNGSMGGDIQVISSPDDTLSFAFIREMNSDKVAAVFNFSGKERKIEIKNNLLKGTYINLFSSEDKYLDNKESFTLGPWEYEVLVKTKDKQ